jgi:tripartite-type tricarboxylate transporter receptor subunit TctC
LKTRAVAGGNIGAQAVAQSAPDGYTVLLYGAGLGINPSLHPTSYNPANDLAPIALVTVIPNLMMVPNSSPAKSVKEFIDYAKANLTRWPR